MDAKQQRGEKRQFGNRRGGRGAPRGRGARKDGASDGWTPVTKLGRLVKDGKVKSIDQIFEFGIKIKEYQIVDHLLPGLKEEVMTMQSVQKQTSAGQRTRLKAYVAIGDHNGHVGLGVKCAKEVAEAIKGAMIQAKLAMVPVRRGYWGATIGEVHTVPCKLTGACGSVRVRLVPAPRGTGIVAAPTPKKFLILAGIEDVFTQTTGHTKTLGNFVKATYDAVRQSYGFQTKDLWKTGGIKQSPMDKYAKILAESKKN
ncbi:40S ribosomal protein S2-4, putative [Entamoeba dispar SAW760]|uniref:Small ribosomal subunit protein uS5 n=2 Tax=Entamoeba dispar (strain ATCC PRA-260 / SAW760) TaxID=370354 RepID=B0EMB4_ENTDS|nr:40S ribosomal protein S2-4, putative [Entamoeba dispar SAW760]EDR24332.1 40S ribosomal protein S2-4, putative [Entamoeba dispar SAW760]|eukprot:EDR24332.1 40S ribosomal protein S2-4, putative [Entamoeba dispar SAW760]